MSKFQIIDQNSLKFAEIQRIKTANEALIQNLNVKCHSQAEIRELLTKITGNPIPASTEINVPFESDFGRNIKIGKEGFINKNAMFVDLGSITIGDRCLLGPNVTLISVNHAQPVANRRSLELAPVTLEDDVWLGANVTVLPGVTIGAGAIIGANSLVTKDVPPLSIAVGSPAQVIKQVDEA
ncbi:DapH/DapD/GlmU-related protein [Fructilactobacillus carniphilus]|uniref:Sugar O-acetyltransferase n=1 Tax=Fructilactobacillus carniphilus TaxID=2940297 RepID=A0ABY5BXG9_9LACO|nr:DapH/DapD/GlmU-related protein [Fructilactobacillus carniphilus]USS90494.1 sugar O-acetyltransferase [Fructilactobacillus carniphilus]